MLCIYRCGEVMEWRKGWWSYENETGLLKWEEEFVPNENDTKTWFHVDDVNNFVKDDSE